MRTRSLLLAALTLSLAAIVAGPPCAAAPPFEAWFQSNTMATDKKTYVHLFWNAQSARAAIEGKDRRSLLAQAARKLAATQIPKTATADLVKLDVVFVGERDSYGMPRWESLEKVAHIEFARGKLLSALADGAVPTEAEIRSLFSAFEVK